jgi:hypothetical protein
MRWVLCIMTIDQMQSLAIVLLGVSLIIHLFTDWMKR